MSDSRYSSGGMGLPGVLTVIFVVLKLTHLIDWSWWWVLSPALVAVGLVAAVVVGAVIFALVDRR